MELAEEADFGDRGVYTREAADGEVDTSIGRLDGEDIGLEDRMGRWDLGDILEGPPLMPLCSDTGLELVSG